MLGQRVVFVRDQSAERAVSECSHCHAEVARVIDVAVFVDGGRANLVDRHQPVPGVVAVDERAVEDEIAGAVVDELDRGCTIGHQRVDGVGQIGVVMQRRGAVGHAVAVGVDARREAVVRRAARPVAEVVELPRAAVGVGVQDGRVVVVELAIVGAGQPIEAVVAVVPRAIVDMRSPRYRIHHHCLARPARAPKRTSVSIGQAGSSRCRPWPLRQPVSP